MMAVSHYTFAQAHRMYNTNSEPFLMETTVLIYFFPAGLLHGQKMAVGDPVFMSQTGRRRKGQMQIGL